MTIPLHKLIQTFLSMDNLRTGSDALESNFGRNEDKIDIYLENNANSPHTTIIKDPQFAIVTDITSRTIAQHSN